MKENKMKLTSKVLEKVNGESVSVATIMSRLGMRYTNQQILNACSYLVKEGNLDRTGRGIYARRITTSVAVRAVPVNGASPISEKHRNFLDKFKGVEGCETRTEFLAKIIDKYKNELFSI